MATAFNTGQKFRFKGENETCTFLKIEFRDGEMHLFFESEEYVEESRVIESLFDIEHI